MNPLALSSDLKMTLRSYLTTIFNVNRDGNELALAHAIEDSFDIEGALAKGPYLEITPPYATGASLMQLAEEGVLNNKLIELPDDNLPLPANVALYSHQERAIRGLISDRRNIVVSSGTGSGKTESFLIPILNDLLTDDTPGVRALLIYPLNALVNDQLDRLRKLLKDTDITFGRYTSELETSLKYARQKYPDAPPNEVIAREQIRTGEKIPQILITNYAMLEYLLLRPEDSQLFQSGLWKYIVLDEAHTYSGAQGVEVGMLLRRLKHRLGKRHGDVQCIATSATLTNDDASEAVDFAQRLFDEQFTEDNIIFGEINPNYVSTENVYSIDANVYVHDDFPKLIEEVRHSEMSADNIALHMVEMGLIPSNIEWSDLAETYKDNANRFVWEILRDNEHLIRLREWMLNHREEPVSLETAANFLFQSELVNSDEQRLALYHLVELGAIARPKHDAPPLLPARYHMFMRSPQGVWVCLNPKCNGRTAPDDSGWSRVFSMHRETCDACNCRVYPIHVCRECGQVFLRMLKPDHSPTYVAELEFEANNLTPNHETFYMTWQPIIEDRSFGMEDELEESENKMQQGIPEDYHSEMLTICVKCGVQVRNGNCQCKDTDMPAHVNLFRVDANNKNNKSHQYKPYNFMNECPRCRSTAQKETEIATPITVSGTGPLSTITYELYRHLPTATEPELLKKPGQGRKLLTFYDNRQGAARFASYLQFTVNTENYRHIFPTVIKSYITEKDYGPNLKQLVEHATNKAWELQIFHNDSDTSHWRKQLNKPKPPKRERDELEKQIKTKILGEITTGRMRRQSLEALGLVAVHYFDDDEPDDLPDFAELAEKLGITQQQTRTLIEYFLDDLRKRKILELPDGVDPADDSFGQYEGHPTLVRGNAQAYIHQQPWIGKTERHARYRYMKLILEHFGLSADDIAIRTALTNIFDWLIAPSTDIMIGSPQEGYRIDHKILIFDTNNKWFQCEKCQRLHAHGKELPCPYPHCGGKLHPIQIDETQANNFFYQSFDNNVIPIRVEEHTAQLESSKGRKYQEDFKKGDINTLSCSTTFEMGIDLGDLQAVVMSNVPPTVANYRQRAGRAGRRASGSAFILTWASDRPHDQTYFRNPPDIIRGQVRIPYIAVDNPYIRRRHINAILLSQFLRHRAQENDTEWKTIGSFFDPDFANGKHHYQFINPWLMKQSDTILSILENFVPFVTSNNVQQWIADFRYDLDKIEETYRHTASHYQRRFNELITKAKEDYSKYKQDIDHYNKLLDRLRNERLIEYFSSHGVLPSYSFPLHSVELSLPSDQRDNQLRLQRDLKVAIREYAPGSEIVADKRIWRSDGLQFYRDTVKDKEYRICETCNHLEVSDTDGIPLQNETGECPICGTLPNPRKRKPKKFVIPDGFFAKRHNNGRPARQYVRSEPSLMKSALYPQQIDEVIQKSPLVSYAYDRNGKLLYVNEGDVRYGGFNVHLAGDKQGEVAASKKEKALVPPISLGHERETDTLHLRFHSDQHVHIPSPAEMPFWVSLMYALIHGASRALQIERNDIDGVLFPKPVEHSQDWEQTIVLYDNVPGGAGHVQKIQREFKTVVLEALKIANCADCSPETSCYHCLRDYNNQLYHHMLRRGDIIRFLEALLNSLGEPVSPIAGAGIVAAINQPLWIMQQIEQAQNSVQLSAQEITLLKPAGAKLNWLDLISELLRRQVEVVLRLQHIVVDKSQPETLSVARYLQVLIDSGLILETINEIPEWQILIDQDISSATRGISIEGACILDASLGEGLKVLTTTHPHGINDLRMNILAVETISLDELTMPKQTKVINYDPRSMTEQSEQDLFADIFKNPVRELYINDAYLYDKERILDRLSAYISMAAANGQLKTVTVHTNEAGKKPNTGTLQTQTQAIRELEQRFPNIKIEFKRKNPEHDRFIIVTRTDNSQARILIGQGLDFIQTKRRNKPTYIVIEDPYVV